MSDEAGKQELQDALDEFLSKIEDLKKDHEEKIQDILKHIDTRRLQEIRDGLKKI